ncbi:hypothetical protein OV079_51735 [Nannocystis pusilla]|uniref:Uncharacterized protein n=1 Tax=Nannocystis pusilla TaxID=889268 RepID=A0A9X3F0M9_9BACT|nr:hypothetical protein [Nannocystis pusilla]MCY1013864.1 hypothetical protein [Nannocystis pusilla]
MLEASFMPPRAPAGVPRQARVLGDAGVLRAAGRELLGEGAGRDEAVAVAGAAAGEADGVQHAVAVERVVALERRDQRVLGVAHVEAGEVVRDGAGDDVEVVGVPLVQLGPPGAAAVRVRVGLREERGPGAVDRGFHAASPT